MPQKQKNMEQNQDNLFGNENKSQPVSTLTSSQTLSSTSPQPGQLPSVEKLLKDSFELMKERLLVIFLSFLLPFLGILGAGILGFIIWIIVKMSVPTLAIPAAVILGLIFFVSIFYAAALLSATPFVALRDTLEQTGVVENLKRARKIMWSVLLANLLVGLCAMGGFVLLVVPGIILSVRYMLAPLIMVCEGKKGRAALAQSYVYVKGRALKVFGRVLLLQVCYFVVYFALQIIIGTSHYKVVEVLGTIVIFVLQFFFSFYAIAFTYTLYRQLKITALVDDEKKYIGAITGWAIWGGVGSVLFYILLFGLLFIFPFIMAIKG